MTTQPSAQPDPAAGITYLCEHPVRNEACARCQDLAKVDPLDGTRRAMSAVHPMVHVKAGPYLDHCVDAGIADLLAAVAELGLRTDMSCQGGHRRRSGGTAYAYILFDDHTWTGPTVPGLTPRPGALTFLEAVERACQAAGDREMAALARAAHCNSETPDDGETYWVCRIGILDQALGRFYRELIAEGHDVNGKAADDFWDLPNYPAPQLFLTSRVAFPQQHIPRIVELLTGAPPF